MVAIRVRFPLGVYHALSADSFGRAEWPPSPVRVIGGLLAAAHESGRTDPEPARGVLSALCAAGPPEIVAPEVAPCGEETVDGDGVVAEVRGASRWAPRNHSPSELKKSGLSPRNLARERTEVHKGGVVIGDQEVEIRWPHLTLEGDQLEILNNLVGDVTFLGTSRSPAVLSLATTEVEDDHRAWLPAPEMPELAREVRVPLASTIEAFDQRHAQRLATGKKPIQKAGHVPNLAVGASVPYAPTRLTMARASSSTLDPRQWGAMLILELDSERSELRPKAAASYLVARAFRSALLDLYDDVGSSGEAPPIIRGHVEEAHAAFVPLPFVGRVGTLERPIAADGLVRGIAIVLPHQARVPDVAEQQLEVERGLRRLILEQVEVGIPRAGSLVFGVPPAGRVPLATLREQRYRGPARAWETVTPVVHSRRRTSSGPRGVERQIAADCEHAGLPAPLAFEVLTGPPLGGGPSRMTGDAAIPRQWRASQRGPRSHLRLTFPQPVAGPVILGKARHFGVGLCIPSYEPEADQR